MKHDTIGPARMRSQRIDNALAWSGMISSCCCTRNCCVESPTLRNACTRLEPWPKHRVVGPLPRLRSTLIY